MEQETFKTSDFYESTLLYVFGYKIIGTEQHGHRIVFEFADSESCRDLIRRYLCKELTVNARELIDGMRDVKVFMRSINQ